MSVPIIAGAGGWQALQALQSGIGLREGLLFGAGVLSWAVVGYLAIRFFLSYVAHHSLTVFVGYRFALGVWSRWRYWPGVSEFLEPMRATNKTK